MFDFMLINGKQIHELLMKNCNEVIKIVANAYIAHDNGNVINPNTYSLKFNQNTTARINALPAYIGDKINLAGIKWISSFPNNISVGIPRASSIIILNNPDNGYPIACLEGSIISAARTAASAVIGAKLLNNNHMYVNSVSFIGCGIISKYIFDFFINTGWRFREINLYDLNEAYAEHFCRYIRTKVDVVVNIVASLEVACKNASLIILATTAQEPYLTNKELFLHNPLVLNISLRDLSPEIIHDSINVVDDVKHCLNANTSTHLAYMKYGNDNFIQATVGELLNSPDAKLLKAQKLKIYSPFGMGMLDVALGGYIYNHLVETRSGTIVHDFFYEITRWS